MDSVLHGVRIVEFAGMGPAPFCGMMLADHGAEVIKIQRADSDGGDLASRDILNRSRTELFLNLKEPLAIELVRRLVRSSDGVIEGYRPGVMERLGLGPAEVMADNPSLVYGRMTGWGQSGPLAHKPGHDINFIALSGVLDLIGRAGGPPVPPLNLLGDFGGGGMLLAFSMVAGLMSVKATGIGRVVDCAMIDGAALLSAMVWSHRAQDRWPGGRGTNLLDGGAPFYGVYETRDGAYIAFGAIESQFYNDMLKGLELQEDPFFDEQHTRTRWPAQKDRVASIVATKTRQQWEDVYRDLDACFSPVLTLDEAVDYPHNAARDLYVQHRDVRQPSPAPRFSDAARQAVPEPQPKVSAWAILHDLGYNDDEITSLSARGVLRAEGARS